MYKDTLFQTRNVSVSYTIVEIVQSISQVIFMFICVLRNTFKLRKLRDKTK